MPPPRPNALGYAGKLRIHPAQVPPANDTFRPSDVEVEWARGLPATFESARGATIDFDGQMGDEVVAAWARAILSSAAQRP